MPRAFSIESIPSFSYASFLTSASWHHSGVSGEASTVARDTKKVDDTLEHSQALFGNKTEVISELREITNECGEDNWDGDGARPINIWAARTAERFIRVLPEGVLMPEVTPEPDGSIGLDWSKSRNQVFSISFGSGLRLAYAWIDGTDRGHGVVRFDGETIPRRILEGLRPLARNY